MRLIYADETGKDLFHYVAFIFKPEEAKLVEIEMAQLAQKYGPEFRMKSRVEFKGSWIYGSKSSWEILENLDDKKIEIFGGFVEITAKIKPTVIIKTVNRKGLLHRYRRPEKIQSVAFRHLLQEVEQQAQSGNFHYSFFADTHSDKSQLIDESRSYKMFGTPADYKKVKLEKMIDLPPFLESHSSRIIQYVDVMAYLYLKWRVTQSLSISKDLDLQLANFWLDASSGLRVLTSPTFPSI